MIPFSQNQLVNKLNFPRGSFFTLWHLLETIAFWKICIISFLLDLLISSNLSILKNYIQLSSGIQPKQVLHSTGNTGL